MNTLTTYSVWVHCGGIFQFATAELGSLSQAQEIVRAMRLRYLPIDGYTLEVRITTKTSTAELPAAFLAR